MFTESSSGGGTRPPRARSVLVYDANCGACTRFMQALDFLDSHRRIDFVSIDAAEESGLLEQIPQRLRRSSFHLIQAGSEVVSGAEALPSLVGLLPTGRLISKALVLVPGGVRIVSFAYSAASRLHGAESCKTSLSSGSKKNRPKLEVFTDPLGKVLQA